MYASGFSYVKELYYEGTHANSDYVISPADGSSVEILEIVSNANNGTDYILLKTKGSDVGESGGGEVYFVVYLYNADDLGSANRAKTFLATCMTAMNIGKKVQFTKYKSDGETSWKVRGVLVK
jgi:hypothetical protein